MSDDDPSDQRPTASGRDNYGPVHQEIRLAGMIMPQASSEAGDRPLSQVYPSGGRIGGVGPVVSFVANNPPVLRQGVQFPTSIPQSVKDLAEDFARILSSKGRDADSRVDHELPPLSHLELGHPDCKNARAKTQEILLRRANTALDRAEKYPTQENEKIAMMAQDIFLAFQYSDQSPYADAHHPLHEHWAREREEKRLRQAVEETGPEDYEEGEGEPLAWPKALFDDPSQNLFDPPRSTSRSESPIYLILPDEAKGDTEVQALVERIEAALGRHSIEGTDESRFALHAAQAALRSHPLVTGMTPEIQKALNTSPTVVVPLFSPEKVVGPMRNSIDILADVGITAAPVGPTEIFSDIWCVFCDYHQLRLVEMGQEAARERRQESRVELALTRHAAFYAMLRMSGFSEDVVAELPGVRIEEACPDSLARALNEVTHDYYSFSPYETAIDERFLNFLQ